MVPTIIVIVENLQVLNVKYHQKKYFILIQAHGIYRQYLQVCTSIFSIAICLHKLTARATITPHYFHIFHFCTTKSGQKYSLPNKRTFNHEPLTINHYLIISKISPLLSKTFNTSFLINLSLPDAKKMMFFTRQFNNTQL